VVYAANGVRDSIDCGEEPNDAVVFADDLDSTGDCEDVRIT
jgi:hypothetical protein